ncbi:hypothetical protein J1N35_005267, partial [Gossypium stocksii]
MELPQGPVTRAQAKAFKDSISALVARIWDDSLPEHIKEACSNSLCSPCIFLQAQLNLL